MPTPHLPQTADFKAEAMLQYARPINAFLPHMQPAPEVTVLPGTDLEARFGQALWRVKSGALRVSCADSNQVILLALPGDMIGVEQIVGSTHECYTQPIVRSVLVRLDAEVAPHSHDLLREAVLQSRRQCIEMTQLRSGQIGERVRLLVSKLTANDRDVASANDDNCDMPSLRVTADIVGSTPESVCRALSAMRQAQRSRVAADDCAASTKARRAGLSGHRASRKTSGGSSHTGRVTHAPA